MASISKTKPCRANLRPILTPFTKPHTHHFQHYWKLWAASTASEAILSHCHIVASNDQCLQLHSNWMAMMLPHCHIVASNDQCLQLHGNIMTMVHPHYHTVVSNNQCQQLYGNWMAMMHPCCHIVASNDQCSNFVATDNSFWQCQRVIAKLLPCHCWYIHCWQWQISQQWSVCHCWQLNGNDTPNGVVINQYQKSAKYTWIAHIF